MRNVHKMSYKRQTSQVFSLIYCLTANILCDAQNITPQPQFRSSAGFVNTFNGGFTSGRSISTGTFLQSNIHTVNKDQGQVVLARDPAQIPSTIQTTPNGVSFVIPSYASGITQIFDLKNKNDANVKIPNPNILAPADDLLPPPIYGRGDTDDNNQINRNSGKNSFTVSPQSSSATNGQELSPPFTLSTKSSSTNPTSVDNRASSTFQQTTRQTVFTTSAVPTTIAGTRSTLGSTLFSIPAVTTLEPAKIIPTTTRIENEVPTTINLPSFLAVKTLISNRNGPITTVGAPLPTIQSVQSSSLVPSTTSLSPEEWRRRLILGEQQPGYAIRKDGSVDPNIAYTFAPIGAASTISFSERILPTTAQLTSSTLQATTQKPVTSPVTTRSSEPSTTQAPLSTIGVTSTPQATTAQKSTSISTTDLPRLSTQPITTVLVTKATPAPSIIPNRVTESPLKLGANQTHLHLPHVISLTRPPILPPSNNLLPPLPPNSKGFYIERRPASQNRISDNASNPGNGNGFKPNPQNIFLQKESTTVAPTSSTSGSGNGNGFKPNPQNVFLQKQSTTAAPTSLTTGLDNGIKFKPNPQNVFLQRHITTAATSGLPTTVNLNEAITQSTTQIPTSTTIATTTTTTIKPIVTTSTVDPFAAFKFNLRSSISSAPFPRFNAGFNSQSNRIVQTTTIANRIAETEKTTTEKPELPNLLLKLNSFTSTTDQTRTSPQSRSLTTQFQPVNPTVSIALPSNDLLPPFGIELSGVASSISPIQFALPSDDLLPPLEVQTSNRASVDNKSASVPAVPDNDLLPPLEYGITTGAIDNLSTTISAPAAPPLAATDDSGPGVNPFLPSLDLNPFLPPFSFSPIEVNQPSSPIPVSFNVPVQSTTTSPLTSFTPPSVTFRNANSNGFQKLTTQPNGFKYTGGFGGPVGVLSPFDSRLH